MSTKPSSEVPQAELPIGQISIAQLAGLFYRKRKGRDLSLEQVSEQVGLSAATLSRFERLRGDSASGDNGRDVPAPDMRTLATVARWLEVSPGRLAAFEPPATTKSSENQVQESVPDMVEAHLRADRNLDEEAALALTRMFRMAYDQFSRLTQAKGYPGPDGSPLHTDHEED